MPELDQLSEIIGTLRAEVKENRRQHDASFKKLDAIDEKITKLTGVVEMLAADHAALKKTVTEEIKPVTEDVKKMKHQGMGVIAFIGLLSGGTGAGILALYKFFYG